MASPEAVGTAVDELRQLFNRGQYDTVLSRAHQFGKRHKNISPELNQTLEAARAFSLIHLGKAQEARPVLQRLLSEPSPAFKSQLVYADLYTAWATSEHLGDAIDRVSQISGKEAKKLHAQLLYRAGLYKEASNLYTELLHRARNTLSEKKQPAATSRWRIPGMASRVNQTVSPITAVELQQLTNAVNEFSTNAIAASILAQDHDSLPQLQEGLRPSYEVEYNAACNYIALHDFENADASLEKAEALIKAELDEDDEDVEEAIAPVFVQHAFLRHMAGDLNSAKQSYSRMVASSECDAASLAVAANNLTVAIGQMALGNSGFSFAQDGTRGLPKQQHEALVEGLKKMRATASRSVERTLTSRQRQAMARNRAVLYIQMGRWESSRTEIQKLKEDDPRDELVSLIDASLLAKRGKLDEADKALQNVEDTPIIRAGRIQLAAACGSKERAAQLLIELFAESPAAVLTAASFLEQCEKVDEAVAVVKKFVSKSSGGMKSKMSHELATLLLRNKRYKESAELLKGCRETDEKDYVSCAQLVIAASHFDADEADRIASSLPTIGWDSMTEDAEKLEMLPPPKRKHASHRKSEGKSANNLSGEEQKKKKKKKKKKKRLPKDYDPNLPPPDPELWLPKTKRSGYMKKKQKGDANNFRGSQGADVASTEAAAQKLAEKSNSKTNSQAGALPPRARPRLNRRKKRNKK